MRSFFFAAAAVASASRFNFSASNSALVGNNLGPAIFLPGFLESFLAAFLQTLFYNLFADGFATFFFFAFLSARVTATDRPLFCLATSPGCNSLGFSVLLSWLYYNLSTG